MEPHDEQQALVVERLRAANGAPVSFVELRAMGVENPALLCYELAAVGLPVERPREPGSSALALSVRLPQSADGLFSSSGHAGPGQHLGRGEHVEDGGYSRGRGPLSLGEIPLVSRSLLVGYLAIMTVLVIGIALVLGQSGGHTAYSLRAEAKHGHMLVHRSGPPAAGPTAGARHAVRSALPVSNARSKQLTISPVTAAALEAEGHQLLAAGRYAPAITDLRNAIQASGGSLSRCAEPISEACLTYAYALYDLGRALQLEGNPAAAIPILSERLRIDNQRETVQQELDIARGANA